MILLQMYPFISLSLLTNEITEIYGNVNVDESYDHLGEEDNYL